MFVKEKVHEMWTFFAGERKIAGSPRTLRYPTVCTLSLVSRLYIQRVQIVLYTGCIYSYMSHTDMVSYIGWGVLSESGENTIVTYIPNMEEYQAYTIVGLITDVLIEITHTEGRS